MVWSDFLGSLVPAGSSGDMTGARPIAGAIIAEEWAERHNVPAEFLTDSTRVNGSRSASARIVPLGHSHCQFLTEMVPRRHLEGLVPSESCARGARRSV